MTLREYLKVPYLLITSSIEGDDGEWYVCAEYPELLECPSCSDSIFKAIDEIEQKKIRYIIEQYKKGGYIPVPRDPLSSYDPQSDLEKYDMIGYVENIDQ